MQEESVTLLLHKPEVSTSVMYYVRHRGSSSGVTISLAPSRTDRGGIMLDKKRDLTGGVFLNTDNIVSFLVKAQSRVFAPCEWEMACLLLP